MFNISTYDVEQTEPAILSDTLDQNEVLVGDFFDTYDRDFLCDQEFHLDIPDNQLLPAIFVTSERSEYEESI